jgi:hypothetical protein
MNYKSHMLLYVKNEQRVLYLCLQTSICDYEMLMKFGSAED